MLRLTLGCRSPAVRWADLACRRVRFFLRGQPQHTQRLYELLFTEPRPEVDPLETINQQGKFT